MCSLREIELFLGHCPHEKSLPKALPMNECLKVALEPELGARIAPSIIIDRHRRAMPVGG